MGVGENVRRGVTRTQVVGGAKGNNGNGCLSREGWGGVDHRTRLGKG